MIQTDQSGSLQPFQNLPRQFHPLILQQTPLPQPGSQEDDQKDRFERVPGSAQGNIGFQFRHLSIRREIAAVRSLVQEDASTSPKSEELGTTAYRRVQEDRQVALNLFYERTRSISVSQDPQTAGHVDSTGGDVGRTFEVNISLEASFLHQFTSQSTTLSEGDNNIFEEYLSATDRMTSLSGEATQGFFHLVDRALDRTMSAVMEGLDGFLEEVGTSFNLEGNALNEFKSQVTLQVEEFFSDLDGFVNRQRENLISPPVPIQHPEVSVPPSPLRA